MPYWLHTDRRHDGGKSTKKVQLQSCQSIKTLHNCPLNDQICRWIKVCVTRAFPLIKQINYDLYILLSVQEYQDHGKNA